jgi:hypothetical protein
MLAQDRKLITTPTRAIGATLLVILFSVGFVVGAHLIISYHYQSFVFAVIHVDSHDTEFTPLYIYSTFFIRYMGPGVIGVLYWFALQRLRTQKLRRVWYETMLLSVPFIIISTQLSFFATEFAMNYYVRAHPCLE